MFAFDLPEVEDRSDFDSGAGVFGGGIITLSVSAFSLFSSSLMEELAPEEGGGPNEASRDLKQLLSSLSPSEKKLELAALCEIGDMATRLMRISPMVARAESLPMRK